MLLYISPQVHVAQLRIPHVGAQLVTQEYINQLVVRVYPYARAGKARMSVDTGRCRRRTGTALHDRRVRPVEAQPATAEG